MVAIKNSLNSMSNPETSTLWRRFVDRPAVYKPFCIIMLLSLVQQFSGTTILRAYVVEVFHTIFREDGTVEKLEGNITCPLSTSVTTSDNAYIAAIVIGVVRLLG